MVNWTRQHFEEIAREIRHISIGINSDFGAFKDDKRIITIEDKLLNKRSCNEFADFLQGTNLRFDRDKFMNACLVKKE